MKSYLHIGAKGAGKSKWMISDCDKNSGKLFFASSKYKPEQNAQQSNNTIGHNTQLLNLCNHLKTNPRQIYKIFGFKLQLDTTFGSDKIIINKNNNIISYASNTAEYNQFELNTAISACEHSVICIYVIMYGNYSITK